MNICVFASGGGSNFRALIEARNAGKFESNISLLITNNSGCGAVQTAKEFGIKTEHISRLKYEDLCDEEYDDVFLSVLRESEIDFIVLAGYMKKIPDAVVDRFEKRIINIHPALLPKFGGEGMYGMNVHRAVIESGEKESGITIHFVNKEYDRGEVILQKRLSVVEGESAESLQERVLELEHRYLAEVIRSIEIEERKRETGCRRP